MVGVGCPAHVLHNCIQHGREILPIDVECIVLKIYNYFSVYTVRTEALKEFCVFMDINYRSLLSHSKTCWLSLFPAVERLLQMYSALQSYILSIDQPPAIISKFFNNEFSEAYLYFCHSLMSIFDPKIRTIEREDNCVVDVKKTLESTINILQCRLTHKFISIKLQDILRGLRENGLET